MELAEDDRVKNPVSRSWPRPGMGANRLPALHHQGFAIPEGSKIHAKAEAGQDKTNQAADCQKISPRETALLF